MKNHHLYSDNFTLSVVALSRIDLATEEDKQYRIDDWAALFKASTWEEIKMLAYKDEYLNEASNTIFRLNADEQIRKQCLDREEYYQDLRSYEKVIAEMNTMLLEKDTSLTEMDAILAKKESAIRERDSAIMEKDSAIKEKVAAKADNLAATLFFILYTFLPYSLLSL